MEDMMAIVRRRLAWCGAAVVMASGMAAVMAQGRGDAAEAGSLGGLTAEIRQLRLAVEESTRTQTQTQALGVYLSAQQARLVQAAARADAARKELDAIMVRSRAMAVQVANAEDALPRATTPQDRAQLEMQNRALKQELETAGFEEQLVRGREAELAQMLQAEDARWADLVSRLEQLIKR
jgi:hypothetical protein